MTDRNPLDALHIDKPCPASWAGMTGDAKRRFCDSCQLHVHDLSAMTRTEATDLLSAASGRVCVRYTADAEGNVLTRELAPVAVAGWPHRLARLASRAVAAIGVGLSALFVGPSCSLAEPEQPEPTEPPTALEQLQGEVIAPETHVLMGDIECPPGIPVPIESRPIESPPVESPPVESPPVESPPVESPPVESPPVESPASEAPQSPPTTPIEQPRQPLMGKVILRGPESTPAATTPPESGSTDR